MSKTILMYGRSRSGKSTCLAELAEHVFKSSGKRTRIYTADKGGVGPIQPYINLGIVEVVEQGDTDIFIFLSKAIRGMVRDAQGKWVPGDNTKIGMFGFESMTAFADGLMAAMIKKISDGTNIGGGANVSFTVTSEGESLKVGGSNMALYGITQSQITDAVWQSQRLPVDYIVWTASASKDEDQTAGGKVIGPAVIGKALTAEVPRWFQYTFRLDSVPVQGKVEVGKAGERHILYLGNNLDMAAGNALGLGNTRVPKDAPELPQTIEPASVVKALQLIDEAGGKAEAIIKQRLGMK